MLCEAGAEPLVTMKIVDRSSCQITADVYKHIRDALLKKAAVNMVDVFRK